MGYWHPELPGLELIDLGERKQYVFPKCDADRLTGKHSG